MNNIVILGNLTRDVESGTTQSGINFCKFSVAVARPHKRDETDFFNVTAWRGLADNCSKYLSKGKKVAVSGSMTSNTYENKEGKKVTTWEVQADLIDFI